MPDPRAVPNLLMPHPGTDRVRKCPVVARGGMGAAGIDLRITTVINIVTLTRLTVWC